MRAGGGLIALGEAGTLPALRPVLPAASMSAPLLPGTFSRAPRSALALAALGQLDAGAVALETRPTPDGAAEPAVAARRVDRGRVLQVGYRDTWRWRLAGVEEDDPVRAHRAWWAALVSSVAYAPRVPLPVEDLLEPTPLASLVETLGEPDAAPWVGAGVLQDPRLVPLLFGLLLGALLLEWLSRRLRGAR